MQDQPKLGELIGDGEKRRDAVHVAIAPVTAAERLRPGQRVLLAGGSTESVRAAGDDETSIGVIDPFLWLPVEEGQRCWLFLRPGTVTSLRHVWTSPAFTVASREALS